jgi:hypothetical protein
VSANADAQTIIVVTSTADSGSGTLRQALLQAQAGDRIQFSPEAFPKANPSTILLLSPLPELTAGNLTIDASDAGVILDGSSIDYPETSGLRILSDGNLILGLQIINFPADGIAMLDGASENTIGGSAEGQGNTLGGNGKNGVFVMGAGSDNNRIIGNTIGLDFSGMAPLPNGMHGINVEGQPRGTVIGGGLPGEGNLVGGNLSAGILIDHVADTLIQGNVIGLNRARNQAIGNATCGIVLIASSGTLIGGEGERFANIIAGNGTGIDIWKGSSGNTITGNLVGYTAAWGNSGAGVMLYDGANSNVIGPNNVIAYNGQVGIGFRGETTRGNTVTANSIFQNQGNSLEFQDGAELGSSTLMVEEVSSHSVSGVAAPGARVEVFSDPTGEARYFEGSTTADEQGVFYFLLPRGTFKDKFVTAIGLDAQGNSSAFSKAQPNPGDGVVKALPNIPAPAQVSTNPAVVGTNLVLAFVSIVFFGFTTTVFNDLVKQFQPQIERIWEKIMPAKVRALLAKPKEVDRPSKAPSRWGFIGLWVLIVLINAVIESFLDPDLAIFDPARLRSVAGLVAAGMVISLLEWGSDLWVHRRLCDKPHVRGELRWFGLLAALATMLFSRSVHFTPGYILGTMGTIFLVPKLLDREQAGRRAAFVLGSILVGGLVLWLLSSVLPPALGWLEALFLNVFAISLQGVLFELIPLDLLDGSDLWKWKKGLWFALFFVAFFGFTHIFLNPAGQDVQALQQNGVRALLVIMAVYGLATLGLWLAFRRAKKPEKVATEA